MLGEILDLVQGLLGDPLLADLPEDIDSEDIKCQIARARGHVIDLTLVRPPENKLKVCVLHNARVSDLQRIVTKAIKRNNPDLPKAYSWRSLWRRYCLIVGGSTRLSDPNRLLVHYSLKNNDNIHLTKRVRVSSRPVVKRKS